MEKIEFEPEIFHKLTPRAHELFFFSLRAIPSEASRFFFFFFISKAMENGKLCINLYINNFEQQFNHSTMPVLKHTNITYKCVSHVKCSCFNKKILINQNKCCSFSWLMIED